MKFEKILLSIPILNQWRPKMEEKKMNNEELEIDLQQLFGALIKKAWLIGMTAILCAVLTFLGTFFFVTPKYKSTAKFYVNNSSLSNLSEAALSSITSADISASRGLVKTYIVILNTRETLNNVIDYAGLDRTYGQLKGMISAASVNDTEIFQVVVTSPDPAEAEKIANAIAYILPNRIKDIIDGTSAKVVESAIVASRPSSPSYTVNTLIGFLLGFVLTAVIIVARELMDITIRTEEDIAQCGKHPVLAAVPDMEASCLPPYPPHSESVSSSPPEDAHTHPCRT
jgi:capsular polysaccharide biosynthesis protein